VPATCQNEAEIRDIERYPDDDRTGRDQESSSWLPTVNRPCKRQVSTAEKYSNEHALTRTSMNVCGRV
jgi:hypothetical protein